MFVSDHDFGDIVFLKTDPEQNERIVTQIRFSGNGGITYYLAFGAKQESEHYGIEISSKKDMFKALNISKSDEQCK